MNYSFKVEFDLKSIESFIPEVQYDAICELLRRLSQLESAIQYQRSRLLPVARDLEGRILYSNKEVSYEGDS